MSGFSTGISIRKCPIFVHRFVMLIFLQYRQLKADLFTVLDKFAEKVVQLHDL